MPIIENPDQTSWNKFVTANSLPSSFPQSWQWGEFQKSLGNKVFRLAIPSPPPLPDTGRGIKGEGYLAVAQAIVRPLPLGKTYLEVPKGPILNMDARMWNMVIEELRKIGRQENAILIRVNPPYETPLQPTTYNLQPPGILLRQTEPQVTILVDLSKSEDELLSAMHEKARYNIRLAERKGVKVSVKTESRDAFDKFIELIEETSKRDGIVVWPKERFEKFRETFMVHNSPRPSLTLREGVPPLNLRGGEGELYNSPQAILLTGEYESKILAAAIVMLFGDSGTYLYAASSAENRNANAPSLVLWEAIRQTKLAGKKFYDMWGIAPAGAPDSHSWSGITRFKSRYIKVGETGKEIHYTGARDLVLNKQYYLLFRLAKKLRG